MPQNIIFSVVADIKQFVAGMQGASKESEKTKEKVKEVKTETTELGKVMDGLQSKIAGAFAVGSIIAFGKQVAQIGAVFDNLTIRVNSLAGSVEKGAVVMEKLARMSNRLGIDLKVLTENYINFISAAKSSGMALSTAERAFNSMNKAMAGAGVNAQTQTQVFQSLQMMIGKTTISSMQLKQIFMAMPESMDVMAQTLGITTKELNKMLKSGEVMAGDILPKFARNMELALGADAQEMAQSMQGLINKLTNSWDNFYRIVSNSGAVQIVLKGLITSLDAVAKGMDVVNKGGMAVYLQDLKAVEVEKARSVMAKINEGFTKSKIDDNERLIRLQRLHNENLEKEAQTKRQIEAIEAELAKIPTSYKDRSKAQGQQMKELKTHALALMQLQQKQSAYNEVIGEEIGVLGDLNSKSDELTEAELKRLRELAKERERLARAENLAKAELNVLNQVEDYDILIAKVEEVGVKRDEALKGVAKNSEQEKLITKKAQVEIQKLYDDFANKVLADMAKDGKDQEAALKAQYSERIKDLDYLRGVDAVSEEEYYKDKLELARKFGEDLRPIITAQYAFQQREEAKAQAKNAEIEKKNEDKLANEKATRIETTQRTFETLGALNNAYTISQTNQLQQQLEQGIISQQQYEDSLRKIRRRQAVLDKAGALFNIKLDTAAGIAKASGSVFGLPLAKVIGALGAVQAGIVLATPIPYNKGTKKVPMVRGAVRGKDSVHAILTPNERVVPEDINTQPGYSALMDLAHDRKISDKEAGFIAKLATGGVYASQQSSDIDYNQLGKSIAKYIPHTDVRIDHNGIAVITDRSHANMNRLKTRL
jgi:tape measure domain-containing protein